MNHITNILQKEFFQWKVNPVPQQSYFQWKNKLCPVIFCAWQRKEYCWWPNLWDYCLQVILCFMPVSITSCDIFCTMHQLRHNYWITVWMKHSLQFFYGTVGFSWILLKKYASLAKNSVSIWSMLNAHKQIEDVLQTYYAISHLSLHQISWGA